MQSIHRPAPTTLGRNPLYTPIDQRRGAVAFAAVLDADIAVGGCGLGREAGLGAGDAGFDGRGVVDGETASWRGS